MTPSDRRQNKSTLNEYIATSDLRCRRRLKLECEDEKEEEEAIAVALRCVWLFSRPTLKLYEEHSQAVHIYQHVVGLLYTVTDCRSPLARQASFLKYNIGRCGHLSRKPRVTSAL